MNAIFRTWTFLIAITLAAPAVAQDSDPEPTPESGGTQDTETGDPEEGEAEEAPDLWVGIAPRVEQLELNGLSLLVSIPQEDAPAGAVEALNAALEAQSPKLMIDDSALGIQPESSDANITKAAENQPVDRIVIARFFPPKPTMVVTVYTVDGEGAGNFALEAGDTSPPKGPKLAIADGGDADTPPAEEEDIETEEEPEGPSEADLERYEAEKWTLESFDDSGIVIRHGQTGETYSGPEALEILGKPNLAESTRGNLALKRGLYWTGGGIAAAGLVSLLIGFFTIPAAFDADKEVPTGSVIAVVGGFGGLFVGIVTAVVGWNIDAVDATRKDARGWVDEKNSPLRDELDIPDHLSRARPAPGAIQFSWAF